MRHGVDSCRLLAFILMGSDVSFRREKKTGLVRGQGILPLNRVTDYSTLQDDRPTPLHAQGRHKLRFAKHVQDILLGLGIGTIALVLGHTTDRHRNWHFTLAFPTLGSSHLT